MHGDTYSFSVGGKQERVERKEGRKRGREGEEMS